MQGAYDCAFRFGGDGLEGSLRDRASSHNGDHARAATGLQPLIHSVAIEICAKTATLRRNAIAQHGQQVIKFLALKFAIRICTFDQGKEFILAPFFSSANRYNLLRQNIEWGFRNDQAVKFSVMNGADQRSAFDQLIARGRKEAAFGNSATPVAGPAKALQ